jgi:hypothetical protein
MRRLGASFAWKLAMKTGFSVRGAKIDHIKTVPN